MSCDGLMCDQNNLLVNNVLVGYCACMQMNKLGNFMINMSLEVANSNKDNFRVRFASKWFMKHLIYSGAFPMVTKAPVFTSFVVEERSFEAVVLVFKYVNKQGGFRVYLRV